MWDYLHHSLSLIVYGNQWKLSLCATFCLSLSHDLAEAIPPARVYSTVSVSLSHTANNNLLETISLSLSQNQFENGATLACGQARSLSLGGYSLSHSIKHTLNILLPFSGDTWKTEERGRQRSASWSDGKDLQSMWSKGFRWWNGMAIMKEHKDVMMRDNGTLIKNDTCFNDLIKCKV